METPRYKASVASFSRPETLANIEKSVETNIDLAMDGRSSFSNFDRVETDIRIEVVTVHSIQEMCEFWYKTSAIFGFKLRHRPINLK